MTLLLPYRPRARAGMWLLCAGAWAALGGAAGLAQTKVGQSATGDKTSKTVVLTQSGSKNSFDFETEQIQGTIGLEGHYHGITRLVEKRTGKQLIYPKLSALNLYYLFSVNQVMGQARTMDRTIRAAPDWVEAKWGATETHKAEITARYQVREPNIVDLTLTVRSQGTYPGYEVFLPNYFDKMLRPSVYLKPRQAAKEPELVMPTLSDVFRGTLLAFPRDAHAARRCLDGRWDWEQIVQVCPVRRYAHCLAILSDPDRTMAVVLMSHPRQCFALSTRYHADKDADRLTPYSAFDLSLFGNDLLPGNEQTARVRLAVTALDGGMSQPLRLYQAFVAEIDQALNRPSQDPARKE